MKWEKQKLTEIDETLENLNKLKALAKDKLKSTEERLSVLSKEMPEYIEIYKKMKGMI